MLETEGFIVQVSPPRADGGVDILAGRGLFGMDAPRLVQVKSEPKAVHEDANAALKKNSPNPIPVILIGRLAVDTRFSGMGLGRSLLQDAFSKAVTAARIVGSRAVIVHALNEPAARFYEKYGFRMVPHGERVMYTLMADIEKSIGELSVEADPGAD